MILGRAGRRAVLVCNTHLISERTVPDVKLFQAHSLLQAVARRQQMTSESGNTPAEVSLHYKSNECCI